MTKRELKLLKSLLRSNGAHTKFKRNMKRAGITETNLSEFTDISTALA